MGKGSKERDRGLYPMRSMADDGRLSLVKKRKKRKKK